MARELHHSITPPPQSGLSSFLIEPGFERRDLDDTQQLLVLSHILVLDGAIMAGAFGL